MTFTYQLQDAVPTDELRQAFGDEVVLFDEQEETTVYALQAEFKLGSRFYAVLQSEALRLKGEVAVFRVTKDADGDVQLETIDDDDEWENVAEIYDEMTLSDLD